MEHSHILFAYNLDDSRQCMPLTSDSVSQEIDSPGLSWVHLDLNHPKTRDWLENEVSHLDPFITDALLADETRPRITQINDGVLINFRGVNFNEDSSPSDMISVRLWIDKDRIISVQRRKLKSIYDIQNLVTQNEAPKNSGEFICVLITKLLHYLEFAIGNLNDKIECAEEKIIAKPHKFLREDIINIRTEVINYRRYIFPQRNAIHELYNTTLTWISKPHKRKLQEEYDMITRYVEDLDSIHERTHIIKDELSNSISDKLNINLYLLSVMSAIFLPLHFIVGLLGVNLSGIPGNQSPLAFGVLCLLLIAVVSIQIVFFKKYKIF
jgi:zinc transporter